MVNNVAKESIYSLIDTEKAFYESLINISALENNLGCIDGKIIGTGRPDYTQKSTEYKLIVKDNEFLLIDIPGIEGDEGKYREIIKESLLKSHVIFYVNGSGKKVEKETLAKIRDYMHDGTSVYAVFNVHCKAKKRRLAGIDKTYQEELSEVYKMQQEIVLQTERELKSFLGNNFKGSLSLNGLLSFCAVALDRNGNTTIIDKESDKNLRREQTKYLKEYADDFKRMRSDSHIADIQNIISQKVERFDEYILEENMKKLKKRLLDMISDITTLRNREKMKIRSFLREYDTFERNCEVARDDFIHTISRIGRSEVAAAFAPVLDELYTEIEQSKGKLSNSTVEYVFEKHENQISADIQNGINKKIQTATKEYQESVKNAEERLLKDLQRAQTKYEIDMGADKLYFDSSFKDSLNFGFGDFARGAFKVASYAFSGFTIGSLFPGIGNIVGAAVGFLVGIGFAVWDFFSSESKRINRAKERLKQGIDEQIDEITADVKTKMKKLGLQSEIENNHKRIKQSIESQKQSLRNIELMLDVVAMELNNRYQRI